MATYNKDLHPEMMRQLEPFVEAEMIRHASMSEQWYPHEYVPWSDGENFDGPLNGKAWDQSQSKISKLVADAIILNLVTEDNLPQYHAELVSNFGRNHPWKKWIDRWTAEEARHSMALRDYVLTTRAIDPKKLEDIRIAFMSDNLQMPMFAHDWLHMLLYTSIEELAARICHRNTGLVCGDPVGDALMAQIARDENLHMIFYRNVAKKCFEIDPEATIGALADVITNFEMPSVNMEGYRDIAGSVAEAGIYNLPIHMNEVVVPMLKFWNIDNLDLSQNGQMHRNRINTFVLLKNKQINKK